MNHHHHHQTFSAFHKAATVHLVETSPHLRVLQRKALNAKPFPVAAWEDTSTTTKSVSGSKSGSNDGEKAANLSATGISTSETRSDGSSCSSNSTRDNTSDSAEGSSSQSEHKKDRSQRMMLPGGGAVHWHTHLETVPEGPIIFIGQEILDALPVHQFEYTAAGWCVSNTIATTPISSFQATS
jgi:hypothetical protein